MFRKSVNAPFSTLSLGSRRAPAVSRPACRDPGRFTEALRRPRPGSDSLKRPVEILAGWSISDQRFAAQGEALFSPPRPRFWHLFWYPFALSGLHFPDCTFWKNCRSRFSAFPTTFHSLFSADFQRGCAFRDDGRLPVEPRTIAGADTTIGQKHPENREKLDISASFSSTVK